MRAGLRAAVLGLAWLGLWACPYAVCSGVQDERDPFVRSLDEENLPRFREVCAALSARPLVRGEFRQKKILKRLGRVLESSGHFIIARDFGLVWETIAPFPSTMALGPDYVIQSVPGGQDTRLEASGNETFMRLARVMRLVFSGQGEALGEEFQVFFQAGGPRWFLGLVPADGGIGAFIARISLSGDTVLRRVAVDEAGGDRIEYELSGHVYPDGPDGPYGLSERERALFGK